MGKQAKMTPECVAYEQTHDPLWTKKPCTECGASKPLSDFYRNMNVLDFRRSECKQCTNKRHNEVDENGYKRRIYVQKKGHAKQDGREFTIMLDEIEWPTHCPIYGTELIYAPRTGDRELTQVPSFDRVDSSRGYVKGNVKIISVAANSLKSSASRLVLQKLFAYIGEPDHETQNAHNSRQADATVSRADADSAIHNSINRTTRKSLPVSRKAPR